MSEVHDEACPSCSGDALTRPKLMGGGIFCPSCGVVNRPEEEKEEPPTG